MGENTLQIGDIVTGIAKTGKYIGEITNIRPQHYLVKIKAVLKHPLQGDLHAPKEVNVPIFHERRALAFNEQTNIPHKMVRLYEGDVPSYEESLCVALNKALQDLESDESEWAKRSLENLNILNKDYFK
ncbi:kinase-associated lipoprotein B [Cytobacillus suaedae]|nr:kinase-associated lipoprotein B [Cytobacillus suaedae]